MKKVISSLRKFGLGSLAFCMALGMALTNINAIDSSSEISVKNEITYNDDKAQATIHLDVAQENENVEVSKVLDPNENEMSLDDLNYVVDNNATYTFKVEYRMEDSQDLQTYDYEVIVNDIIDATSKGEISRGALRSDISTRANILGDNEYIVYTLDELKTYAEIPNATVYFGADII
ncbi:hypothetical protein LJC02_03755, partial [Breznakia sp. OttesenSCG-928-G09]|nr:hypothetical protein [Breznakia sp. OttesenSCG-928-G09]